MRFDFNIELTARPIRHTGMNKSMKKHILCSGSGSRILILCCLMLTACAGDPPREKGLSHGTQRFEGTVPCADCSGIVTRLIFEHDAARDDPDIFYLHERYIDSAGGQRVNSSWGNWSQYHDSAERCIYQIDPEMGRRRHYLVLDNGNLQPLDIEGDPMVDNSGKPVMLESSSADTTSSPAAENDGE